MTELTMVEALNLALKQEMENDDSVIVLGEDVGVDGGVFRVTDGLIDDYGEERVVDTPLDESAIAGMGIGMAVYGLMPVCEMQFSGFSYLALNQLEAHASRLRLRSRGRFHVPMVVRMPYGAGVRALEHHSESMETLYAHIPGLKMVIPSGPRNARALLVSAIRDPDPVVFFEPKLAYRAFREEVPDDEETLPLGQSQRVREGEDITLIGYGAMLRRTLEATETLAKEDGAAAEVIAGKPAAFDVRAMPAVVFTDPQIAWCGLSEREANEQDREVTIARFPWRASGRARTLGIEGLTKLVLDKENGRVVGVGIVGRGAEALIAEGALAVEMGAVARDLALTVHPHPTLSETLGEAAGLALDGAIHFRPDQDDQ